MIATVHTQDTGILPAGEHVSPAELEIGDIVRDVTTTRVIAHQYTPHEPTTDGGDTYRILDRREDGSYTLISTEDSMENATARAHILN